MNRCLLVILACLVVASVGVTAEEEPLARTTVPVAIHVPQVVKITVSAQEIVFQESDFDLTETAEQAEKGIYAFKSTALEIDMAGNIGYLLQVSSVGDFLIGLGNEQLPFSQLSWKLDTEEDDAWRSLSTTDEVVLTSQNPGLSEVFLDFRLLATWNDAPTTYIGTIRYTVVPYE